MSLLEDLKSPPARIGASTGICCKVGELLQRLEGDEAEALRKAIEDIDPISGQFSWPSATLAKTLRKNDKAISDNTIGRHRREHLEV